MKKKILVIEDNFDVRENIAELLELSDYDVISAINGREGIQKALKSKPDLIVCDVMMPEMDGYSVLSVLSKNHLTMDTPFIFLTAKSERDDFRKGMSLGADDYITKPFTDVELLDAIDVRFKKADRIKTYDSSPEGFNLFINETKANQALTELSSERTTKEYKKKEFLFKEEDTPNFLFFINSGKFKVYRKNDFGKEFITSIAGKGDFLGYTALLKDDKYYENVAALEESLVSLIPKNEFLALIHGDRDVSSQLIRRLAKNISEKEERLLKLAYDSVRRRVADALLRVAEKSEISESSPGKFGIRREDLANVAGTTKETCIRTLADFKDEKLVEIVGNKIGIINWNGLRDIPN